MNDKITLPWLRSRRFVIDRTGWYLDVSPAEYVHLRPAVGAFNTTGDHWVVRIQFSYGMFDATLKSKSQLVAIAKAMGIEL